MGAGLLLLALSSVGILRPLSDVSYTIVSPFEDVLRSVAQPIADVITNFHDVQDLTKQNEALRAENERLQADIARLQEAATQQQELQRLLDVKNAIPNQDFVAATVFERQPSNLRDMVAIDRGRNDGIKIGMPVVTEGKTLVGRVTKVEDKYAWVTLITDIDSSVSGIILESRAQGVVSGGYNRQLTMEFVNQDATVKEGDTVLTSGIGGTYPPGLVVGQVTNVAGGRQEIFQQVTVEPLASLSRLETVLVMDSFVPVRVAAP